MILPLSWNSKTKDTENQPEHAYEGDLARAISLCHCSLSFCMPTFAPSHPLLHCPSTRSSSPSPEVVAKLYRRRVQHDANRGTERLGRQVGPELGANDAAVAVWPGDLAPDDADLGALDGLLSAVDVCYALTGVPLCCLGVVYTLELEQ